jgi:hypothetical protein
MQLASTTPACRHPTSAVNARHLDPAERCIRAEAIRKVFGDAGPPVTSTKGVTGHMIRRRSR